MDCVIPLYIFSPEQIITSYKNLSEVYQGFRRARLLDLFGLAKSCLKDVFWNLRSLIHKEFKVYLRQKMKFKYDIFK